MAEGLWIRWRVVLDYTVHRRNVETPSSHVGAEQDCKLRGGLGGEGAIHGVSPRGGLMSVQRMKRKLFKGGVGGEQLVEVIDGGTSRKIDDELDGGLVT